MVILCGQSMFLQMYPLPPLPPTRAKCSYKTVLLYVRHYWIDEVAFSQRQVELDLLLKDRIDVIYLTALSYVLFLRFRDFSRRLTHFTNK